MTGTRGPLPKPTRLKLLEGNPGKRALNLSDGLNPPVEVPSMPKHLGPEARKEWRRITPLLEELGLISGLDRAALALYCQAVGRLAELETSFSGKVDLHVAAGMTYANAVFEVSHTITPSGYAQQSVMVQLLKSQREQVNRFLMHFGLSPAARARVQPSNHVQASLPGVDELPASGSPVGFQKFAIVG